MKAIYSPKINLLIEGWFNIPHSYANVACFEMFAMHKCFSSSINFYILEKEYFSPNWKKTTVLPENYCKVLFNESIFKKYNNEKIDIIYRVVFPYDISINNDNMNVPKCVFYTSEYAVLGPEYFSNSKGRFNDLAVLKKYLTKFGYNLYFTSPSRWSSLGLEKISEDYKSHNKNRTITHGVDTTVFYKDPVGRKITRDRYSIKDTDVLMMNVGAMTSNKGIVYIILTLAILVKNGFTNLKLFIKGIADLYQTTNVLQGYFNQLINHVSKEEMDLLIKNNIIITYDTLNFSQMKDLYNACDIYISPYIAEGFNLTPLEALACGCNVAVSNTGSTEDYINDIYNNGGSEFIYKIESKVIKTHLNDKSFNEIDPNNLIQLVHKFLLKEAHKVPAEAPQDEDMISYIKKEYNWDRVAELKVQYFRNILQMQI